VLRERAYARLKFVYVDQPKIVLLRGEIRRERVISPTETTKYLAAAPEPLASVATVPCDTGMRPEECYGLRWGSNFLGEWATRDTTGDTRQDCSGSPGTANEPEGQVSLTERVGPQRKGRAFELGAFWRR
jgi:hypothetical protein